MTTHADGGALAPTCRRRSRRWPSWPAASATRRCATWARIGGSIANNDPAAYYPAAVLGLGATVHTDQRKIAADDFFTGCSRPRCSRARSSPRSASRCRRTRGLRQVQAAGVALRAGRRVRRPGRGRRARRRHRRRQQRVPRHRDGSRRWTQSFTPERGQAVKLPADRLNSDMHGSAEYRAAMISVMARARGGEGAGALTRAADREAPRPGRSASRHGPAVCGPRAAARGNASPPRPRHR